MTLNSTPPPFLVSIAEERQRRMNGRKQPDPYANKLWQHGLGLITEESTRNQLIQAYQFASTVKYGHGDLPSAVYLAHPVRVAAMVLLSQKIPNGEAGIIGLLHNVLEVSSLTYDNLLNLFGKNVANQVMSLTVNRKLQWNTAYKQDYYDALNAGPKAARLVKVLDKLDNLFLLGLNPDEGTRHRYLVEIETHIIPMTQREIPNVVPYMKDLLEDCHKRGFWGS